MNFKCGRFAGIVSYLVLSGFMMSGCSDENGANGENKIAAEATPPSVAKNEVPAIPSLMERGVSVLPEPPGPEGNYYKMNSGMDLLYLFAHHSAKGFDAEAAINKIYPSNSDQMEEGLVGLIEKYKSGDEFTKRDLAKQISPILIENASKFSSVSYVTVDIASAINLGRYDFDRQGFVTNNSLGGEPGADNEVPYTRGTIRFSDVPDYKLSFINAAELDLIKIPENVARDISQYDDRHVHNVNFRFYGFVHSVAEDKTADYRLKYVVMKITKVELVSNLRSDPVKVLATVNL